MLALLIVAVMLVGGALYQVAGLRRDARKHPPPGVLIDVDDQHLHVVCAGDGQPAVLFESGIAASSLSWTPVQRDVSAFARACAYDRAGLGWSPPARHPRTVARMLREMQGVLAHASTNTRAILVGHSFGAYLVCAYASRRPDDVAGIVLLDPPSEWDRITPERAYLLWGGIQLSRIGGLLARAGVVRAMLRLLTGGAPAVPRTFVKVFGPTAATTLEHLVGEVRKLPPEIHPIVQAHWCQPKCFRALADHLAALEETAAVAAAVTSVSDVPLVIISSGDQPPEVLARHRGLTRLSRRGEHLVAERAGHWVQFDAPELVVRTIRRVAEQVAGRGTR